MTATRRPRPVPPAPQLAADPAAAERRRERPARARLVVPAEWAEPPVAALDPPVRPAERAAPEDRRVRQERRTVVARRARSTQEPIAPSMQASVLPCNRPADRCAPERRCART